MGLGSLLANWRRILGNLIVSKSAPDWVGEEEPDVEGILSKY